MTLKIEQYTDEQLEAVFANTIGFHWAAYTGISEVYEREPDGVKTVSLSPLHTNAARYCAREVVRVLRELDDN